MKAYEEVRLSERARSRPATTNVWSCGELDASALEGPSAVTKALNGEKAGSPTPFLSVSRALGKS